MSVALRGNLKDFGIADVFQLIGQQRKTGCLSFRGREGRVEILFDRGLVVSAHPVLPHGRDAMGEMLLRCGLLTRDRFDALDREREASAQTLTRLALGRGWVSKQECERIEELLTRETIFDVLRWSDGSFDFTAREVEHQRSMDSLLGAEQILMDGLRMVDEWQSCADQIPSEAAVFQRSGHFEDYREKVAGDARRVEAAERVFLLVDGRLAVRRIIDLSMLGTFDATRSLADLRRAGVIELARMERPRHRLAAASASLTPGRLRAALGAVIPVAILAAATALVWTLGPRPETAPALAIQRAPLASARAWFVTHRVRRAVEAYRFIHGEWPADLSALTDQGLLTETELAPETGAAYYYARRESGVLLLSPEQ